MPEAITASTLYNFVQCPHRVALDMFEDEVKRDSTSKFVQLLWERGTAYENEVIKGLNLPFTDLSELASAERERETQAAIARGDRLIYHARIRSGDLIGEPDLLRKESGGYIAIDIKSGAGDEASNDLLDRKPKKHYAVQLALYEDILEQHGVSAGRKALVWDIHGKEIEYDFSVPQGARTPETLGEFYYRTLNEVRAIAEGKQHTQPCLASICKMCHWRSVCSAQLREQDDLSLIPELGRTKRDAFFSHIQTVTAFAAMDCSPLINGERTVIPGVGAGVLLKLHERAQLLANPESGPYLTHALSFPHTTVELFFDIEADPMRDICYLHGFVERANADNDTEQFIYFLAESPTPKEEERAFSEAVAYILSKGQCAIYYYSKYERTWYRNLQRRYPAVISEDEIEKLFTAPTSVDLYYDAVNCATVWPTNDHSIKTLAKFLGFQWRDVSPSGADSIEWYHRWVESGDESVRQRILDYNQDDCLATRVLLDSLRNLPLKNSPMQ